VKDQNKKERVPLGGKPEYYCPHLYALEGSTAYSIVPSNFRLSWMVSLELIKTVTAASTQGK
jgi:hypothetical protein